MVMGFTGVLKVGTTTNYNSRTDVHTLQFTAARTVSSFFTGCRLVTASNATDPSASVSHDSGPRWLLPISQLDYTVPGYSLITRAIPHALTTRELHSLTAVTRLYCSAAGS
jgi:hypothetical protein